MRRKERGEKKTRVFRVREDVGFETWFNGANLFAFIEVATRVQIRDLPRESGSAFVSFIGLHHWAMAMIFRGVHQPLGYARD